MTQRAGHGRRALHRFYPVLKGVGAILMMGTLYSSLAAAPPHRKKPHPDDYALITGTVFNSQGAVVPNATVDVREIGGHHHHWQSGTDEMGEFFVHVPPGKADYSVEASASGFRSGRVVIHVLADERETIFLHLAPHKK